MNDMYDVSIIIVNYNTADLTRNCINSIYSMTKDISFEIIVSDNGSSDGSIEMIKSEFPNVVLIENNKNLGFGAANNRAKEIANGKYIFFLNSDTLLLNNAVKIFYDYWEKEQEKQELGALGTILINEKNEPIHSGGKFPTYFSLCKEQFFLSILHLIKSIVVILNLYAIFPFKYKQKRIPYIYGEVDYITGADLFVKNDENALFDERFFLYYEETDIELQLYKKGLKRILI
jgi:GT2 family glycosyltransferase